MDLSEIKFDYNQNISVFNNLNFELKSNEKVGILGSNGSGKSTLLELMVGLLKPQNGVIELWGKRQLEESDFKVSRRRIGFLFQDPDDQLFCPTVEEDIAFGPLNLQLDYDLILSRINEVSARLNINLLRKRIPFDLSLGQKKLVALAGILVMEPDILILDEPTASLDEALLETIADYLKESKCAMVIASHNRNFLNTLCNKLYQIQDQKLKEL
ncbi:MAG: energy-coupling factor ABC transporter ATP-binding protein [Nitrospinota bacterium]